MAYFDIDPDLLQRIRLEIAARSDGQDQLGALADIGRDRLKVHLQRLFYGGELNAECRVNAGELHLDVRRLTPYGVLAMHAQLTRSSVRRAL